MLLLHEYLHSLGYLDEHEVKRLVYEISRETLGENHPASRYALNPPFPRVFPSEFQSDNMDTELEIIKDFERSNLSYIN